jgi:hypothetical protein
MCRYCNEKTTTLVTLAQADYLACEDKYTDIPVCDRCANQITSTFIATREDIECKL